MYRQTGRKRLPKSESIDNSNNNAAHHRLLA